VLAGLVVALLAYAAYLAVLGGVAALVVERFLDESDQRPRAAVRALGRVAGREQLLVHATEPELQRKLERTGVVGALQPPEHDYVDVVGNNAAGNKTDFYRIVW
jgi:hypothetical protein